MPACLRASFLYSFQPSLDYHGPFPFQIMPESFLFRVDGPFPFQIMPESFLFRVDFVFVTLKEKNKKISLKMLQRDAISSIFYLFYLKFQIVVETHSMLPSTFPSAIAALHISSTEALPYFVTLQKV